MIYIASPYTHELEQIRQARYEQVFRYTRRLTTQGAIAFSPIVYGHQFALAGFPGTVDFWRDFNESLLVKADYMHVLMLMGWKDSVGLAEEIDFANRFSIPVTYIEMNGEKTDA